MEAAVTAADLASSKLGGEEEEDEVDIPESEDESETEDVALANGAAGCRGSMGDFLSCGEVNPPKVLAPPLLFLHALEDLLGCEGAESDSVAFGTAQYSNMKVLLSSLQLNVMFLCNTEVYIKVYLITYCFYSAAAAGVYIAATGLSGQKIETKISIRALILTACKLVNGTNCHTVQSHYNHGQ